uniref:Uncharacterized protein n=1 Tax=Lotus japonicus TaxID=34305 RepID=I3SZQ3_LOTJA|nr:unknown [Lotus japonicus]
MQARCVIVVRRSIKLSSVTRYMISPLLFLTSINPSCLIL